MQLFYLNMHKAYLNNFFLYDPKFWNIISMKQAIFQNKHQTK